MGLEGQTIEELRVRVMVASRLIKMLQQDDDPRAEGAIEVLREQQRKINEVLVRKIREEPEAVVVGLKAVELRARRLRR